MSQLKKNYSCCSCRGQASQTRMSGKFPLTFQCFHYTSAQKFAKQLENFRLGFFSNSQSLLSARATVFNPDLSGLCVGARTEDFIIGRLASKPTQAFIQITFFLITPHQNPWSQTQKRKKRKEEKHIFVALC